MSALRDLSDLHWGREICKSRISITDVTNYVLSGPHISPYDQEVAQVAWLGKAVALNHAVPILAQPPRRIFISWFLRFSTCFHDFSFDCVRRVSARRISLLNGAQEASMVSTWHLAWSFSAWRYGMNIASYYLIITGILLWTHHIHLVKVAYAWTGMGICGAFKNSTTISPRSFLPKIVWPCIAKAGGKGCTHKFLHYRIMIQGICMDTEWVIFISMLIQSRCAAYSLFGANCILK